MISWIIVGPSLKKSGSAERYVQLALFMANIESEAVAKTGVNPASDVV